MTLDGVRVHRDHLVERMQRDISVISTRFCREDEDLPNVIIPVRQELSEDVNSHHPQSAICLNLENSQYGLV